MVTRMQERRPSAPPSSDKVYDRDRRSMQAARWVSPGSKLAHVLGIAVSLGALLVLIVAWADGALILDKPTAFVRKVDFLHLLTAVTIIRDGYGAHLYG